MKPKRTVTAAAVGMCFLIAIPCLWFGHTYRKVSRNEALIAAIELGDASAVESLLAAGADPNTRAIPHKQKPLLQLLRDLLHTPPPPQAQSALHVALRDGHLRPSTFRVVKALIAAGANVNARDKDGDTPLTEATYFGEIDCIRVLIDAGANVKGSPLQLIYAISRRNIEGVRLLIAAGADVNAKTVGGATALYLPARDGYTDGLKEIVSAGADLNVKDDYGMTALMQASLVGNLDCVKLLLRAGADVNAKCVQRTTALDLAYTSRYFPIVDILRKAGAKGKE